MKGWQCTGSTGTTFNSGDESRLVSGASDDIKMRECRFQEPCPIWMLHGREVPCSIWDIPGIISRVVLGSIYLGDPRVDSYHHIIQNTHFMLPSSWSHTLLPSCYRSTQFVWFITYSCQVSIDPCNLYYLWWLGITSYPLTIGLCSIIEK